MKASARLLLFSSAVIFSALVHGQVTADTLSTTPDHWVAVDLKKWAWYLNFTREQKETVRTIDEQFVEREARLEAGADYVDTESQRAARCALVAACTGEVQAALDSARYARWLHLRNGAQPVKPSAGGTMMRFGPVRF